LAVVSITGPDPAIKPCLREGKIGGSATLLAARPESLNNGCCRYEP
jgi:hypothetical protein